MKKAKKKINRISNNKNISIAWMFRPKMGPIFVSSTFPHFISADYMKKGKGISFQDFATISNVWVAKKDTKRSSNTLLRLVSFFATQTLPDNLALFWQLLSTTAVQWWKLPFSCPVGSLYTFEVLLGWKFEIKSSYYIYSNFRLNKITPTKKSRQEKGQEE